MSADGTKKSQQRCATCDEPGAAKHYGQLCCSGCKGFFRRSIRSARKYVCTFEGKCDVRKVVHSDRAKDSDFMPREKRLSPIVVVIDDDDDSGDKAEDEAVAAVKKCGFDEGKALAVARKAARTMLATSYHLLRNDKIPLGARKIVPAFDRDSADSVVSFLFLIDDLMERFCDTELPLFSAECTFDMSVSLSEGFFTEPGKMCQRALALFEPNRPMAPQEFPKIWCRLGVQYVDWATHFPEFYQLDADDQYRLLVGRCIPILYHFIASRCRRFKKRCIVMCGGVYVPLDAELENADANFRTAMSLIGSVLYDNYLELLDDLHATETEIQLLRTIAFFSIVPEMSKKGRAVVRRAQGFYRSVLHETIRMQNPEYSEYKVTERISALLCILPNMELTTSIEDNYFSAMTMFNPEYQEPLFYEFYMRRK